MRLDYRVWSLRGRWREAEGGGSAGTASDMMGLLMVIIGGGFDSNYMIAAQCTQSGLSVCLSFFKEKFTQNCCSLLKRLFASAACFSPFLFACLCVSECVVSHINIV